jgi:hypothetical protein
MMGHNHHQLHGAAQSQMIVGQLEALVIDNTDGEKDGMQVHA